MPDQKKRAAPSANRQAAHSKNRSEFKYIAAYVAAAIGAPALAFLIAFALAEVSR